jgi:hypothetical protein
MSAPLELTMHVETGNEKWLFYSRQGEKSLARAAKLRFFCREIAKE